ncbi:MAG: Zn-dependent hydrolase [Bacillus sp. (in: firmicutes)]
MEKQKIRINGDRLQKTLERFADFGRTEKNGVTRLSLSEEDRLARDYFCSCCEELGMTVKVDDIGNIYAVLAGEENGKPIIMGSHLDTVKKGGRFDGVLGVVAGLEVVRTLVENDMKPSQPIMIVDFTNEEGARFEPSMMSSGVLSGKFDKSIMLQKMDSEGITFEEALQKSGYAGNPAFRLQEGAAFLELHIEQGPILEREGLSIGVVECVVGMVCYEIEVTGDSDHAGTTPMNMRKDALQAAVSVIADVREKLGGIDEELVFTFGRMNVSPNIHTVIPNKAVFSLEARHKDPEIMRQVEKIIQDLPADMERNPCDLQVKKLWDRETVWFDAAILEKVEHSVNTLGYSYKRMVSGAGHDAQFIAGMVPAAMVFVPSVKGKSHSEDELTYWEDCENGVNVLLETVLLMQSS